MFELHQDKCAIDGVEVEEYSSAQNECGDLTATGIKMIGSKEFAGAFHCRSESTSALCSQWKKFKIGPFWSFRELLIKIEKSSPTGIQLVDRVLNFLARPFNRFVIEYIGSPDQERSYVSGMRQAIGEAGKYFESIEKSIDEAGPAGSHIDFEELEQIEHHCDRCIAKFLGLKELARKKMIAAARGPAADGKIKSITKAGIQ